MPLVSLVELENSLKMNQFINQHHPQFASQHHHHAQQQQQQQQQYHVGCHGNGGVGVGGGVQSPAPGFYASQVSSSPANSMNNLGNSNNSNMIANEIINQIQSMNAINLNSKLLTNITNNLMMNGIKPSTASSILSGINLNALSQSIQSKHVNYSRYKTELCRQFSENGECKYGDKCQFAHGFNDLKDVNRHPKYKTDFCKTFHSKGFCPYGPRCHFIHDLSEKFDMSILNVSSSGSPQTSASQAAHDSMIISKYLNGLNNKASHGLSHNLQHQHQHHHHHHHHAMGLPTDGFGGKDAAALIDKELEAIQMQITSSLFSNANEELNDDEKKTTTANEAAAPKTEKEQHILTPQSSLDELEVSLSQSLSLLSYAQSPSMSSSSASSSSSAATSSHASSSGSSKSSSPISLASNNIIAIGESNLGAGACATVTDLSCKNDPLSILLLSSPSPSSSSASSSSSLSSSSSSSSSSARSSASSSNENVFRSSANVNNSLAYFNSPLNDNMNNLLSKATRLQSPAAKAGSLKTAQSFDKWTSLSGETTTTTTTNAMNINDSSLLAINANADPSSMMQLLRQHQQSNVIKRPESVGIMTPPPIGSHLSKTTQSGGKLDNSSSYHAAPAANPNKMVAKFNMNW